MAFNAAPSNFFGAGYSLAASEAKFTTADSGGTVLLSKLSDAKANATTGDARDICRALCYAMYEKLIALETSDRPVKMTIAKAVAAQADLTTLKETYTFEFYTADNPGNVVAEP